MSEPTALTVDRRKGRPPVVAQPQPLVVQGDGPASVLSMIAQLATNPAVNIETMRALMDMRREMAGEDARRLFTEAMHAAQAAIPPVARNGKIKLGKDEIPFTTYEDVMAVLQPIMDEHGFSVTWDTEMREGGGAQIVGILTHRAGHFVTSKMFLPLDSGPARNNVQAMGSTITYGRRYVLENLFNIVRKGADKDGNVIAGVDDATAGITEAQALEIEALLLKTKSDRAKFMAHFGITNLLEMNETQRVSAVNSLQVKMRREGAA